MDSPGFRLRYSPSRSINWIQEHRSHMFVYRNESCRSVCRDLVKPLDISDYALYLMAAGLSLAIVVILKGLYDLNIDQDTKLL